VHYSRIKGGNGVLESVLIGLRTNVAGANRTVKATLSYPFSRSTSDSFAASRFRPLSPRISQPHSSQFDPIFATPLHVDAMIGERTRVHNVYIRVLDGVAFILLACHYQCRRLRWSSRELKRRRSEVKESQADAGLAPDCIYSSSKRFTFTKSFQLHAGYPLYFPPSEMSFYCWR